MNKKSTRLTAIAGTTMALVIVGTAAVSAHPGDRGDRGERGDQRGKAGIGAPMGAKNMPGARAMGGMRGMDADFERTETTIQTADGVTTRRIEQGVVDSASETSLSFTLGSGEAVTITIDEDTQLVALEEQTVERGRRSRERMVPTEVEATELEAGAEIVAWSDSEDGGEFVASRIVVQPVEEAEAEAEAADAEETVEETVTEDASTTDA